MADVENRRVTTPPDGVDLARMSPYFLAMMVRNIATDGYPFLAPALFAAERPPGAPEPAPEVVISRPGCIIASPSYREVLSSLTQNYVYNWVRDAAIAVAEITATDLSYRPDLAGVLEDYVSFAARCQAAAPKELDRAKYTVAGDLVEGWPRQNDGPALQALALLGMFDDLAPVAQETARQLIAADLGFVLDHYQLPSFNLWEEVCGHSFFTRSVQLKCLDEIGRDAKGVAVPADRLAEASAWLRDALREHVADGRYVSILNPTNGRGAYDPNSDAIAACLYGAVDCTDPVLLNTASALLAAFTDPGTGYPINATDGGLGIGPLIGRYPGDYYDGNHTGEQDPGATRGHPWVVCTANLAELYYRVAAAVRTAGSVPDHPLAADFLRQAGVRPGQGPEDAVDALHRAGDRMLQAIVYHGDHLELSEQFDARTGYESSVRNLSWSYAAVLSALRARAALAR
jgi:glucoamylase